LAHSNKNSLTLEEAKEIVHVSIELLTAISQQEQDSSSIGGIGGGGGSGGIGGMGGGGGYDENTILRSLICLGTLSLTFPTTLKSLIQEKLLPVSARMKASVICSMNKDNTPSMLTICWKELEEILEIH
jgi:hypothetical protein